MKHLYKPYRPKFPFLGKIGDIVGKLWGCVFWLFLVWLHIRDKPFLPALVSFSVLLLAMSIGGFVITKLGASFTIQAYDDGHAIVLKRGRHFERIPLHQISQVDYVTSDEAIQKVRLHLNQPSRFGEIVTFVVARDSTPDRHSDIADDLHRRARAARENQPSLS